MPYLGQEYKQGLVIQRSEKGSAFQEVTEATIEGTQEIEAKLPGGIKKAIVTGGAIPVENTKIFVNPDYASETTEGFPLIVKPDTKEPYATLEEVKAMTADEALAMLEQFREDYDLGVLYKMEDEFTTEYAFEGYFILDNTNYEVNYIINSEHKGDYDPDETIINRSLFITNAVYVNVSVGGGESPNYSNKIMIRFPEYIGTEVALCDSQQE